MVKFVFGGLICCGVANGLICTYVKSPERNTWMVVVMIICCVLLVWHWHATKSWCDAKKRDYNVDYDEDHPRIFIRSFFIALILLVLACFIGHMGFVAALVTLLAAFAVAARRETMYTY